MSDKDTGGPAFPSHGSMGEVVHEGMTARDYFATHSTQPGVIEIAKAAGVGIDANHRIYLNELETAGISFSDWWLSLTLERQCELSAAVRYAQADAMLKERAK